MRKQISLIIVIAAFFLIHPILSGFSLEIDMAFIESGSFLMGQDRYDSSADEKPVHVVNITNSFLITRYEITYSQWYEVYNWAIINGYTFSGFEAEGRGDMGGHSAGNPIHTDTESITDIEWFDTLLWCNALSEMEGKTPCYYTDASQTTVYRTGRIHINNDCVDWDADGYRLPTEAEWEYACRAGTNTIYYWGEGEELPDIDPFAWYNGNSNYRSHPVGEKLPNGWGLFDISGNNQEWIWDRYNATYYSSSPSDDPKGPDSGSLQHFRGGSWIHGPYLLRSANRNWDPPYVDHFDVSFRPGRLAPPVPPADITVSPLDYDYQYVEVGKTSTAVVTISNDGESDLIIDDLVLIPSGASLFYFSSEPDLPLSLPPDWMIDVEITFVPQIEGSTEALFIISSDDPDESIVEVQLTGTGVTKIFCGDYNDNIEVGSGEIIVISCGAFINGNIDIEGGTVIIEEGSSINGNIKAWDGGDVSITGSSYINGTIEAFDGSDVSILDGSEIVGNVKVLNSGCILEITYSTVGGNVETEGIDSLTVTNSIIGGNIISKDNEEVIIHDNDVNGDVIIE